MLGKLWLSVGNSNSASKLEMTGTRQPCMLVLDDDAVALMMHTRCAIEGLRGD